MPIHALDLFCGAGGSSQGAVQAGAVLVGAIDAWDLATATIKSNHPGATVLTQRLGPDSRPDKSLVKRGVQLLLASPECTNHSVAKGNAPRCEESKRSANYIVNYIEDLEPKWVVLENVVQMRDWHGYDPLIGKLHRLGYGVTPQVIDSADFGVPQTRKRLFLLCARGTVPQEVPVPSGILKKAAKSFIDLGTKWPSRVLYLPGRAEATLARAGRAMAELGTDEPFLIVYYGSDGAGGWQSIDRPIRTLTTLDRFGLVTWRGGTPFLRMLQVEELKAAMGFPPAYKFEHGARRDHVKMLGNGVCPPVMEAIVRHLTAPTSPIGSSDGGRSPARRLLVES
ncbi:DNA cytosine methyltransferase [Rubrivivax gelatinosus]|uniref:DNA cytosine methyltransferase n=1 Tax=Rubrivivax gelatinosus TaxID=28068 RepID=UPI000681EB8E|nr:DNA cytosine methyltransferase [Rubrivivax gelatinosus]MBG6080835.1 DNA (cytosine-5)-methyltransferase 1 [Rubrivivax gelatinosus]